jgi:predicted metal-dependent TIM-barrel fold hydrolase
MATVTEIIRRIGPEKIIISSDYGQKGNGSPVDGLVEFVELLLREGIPAAAIERMAKYNPAFLLNL